MKKSHITDVGLDLEYFLTALFGKASMHGCGDALVGEGSERLWKRVCDRIVDHLAKYITLNVTTDPAHEKKNCRWHWGV